MAEFNAMDTAAFKGVWVFCEQREGEIQSISYQLLSEGRKLANDLGVELCGILLEENRLMEIVKLIGADVLPDDQKLIIEIARVVRVGFLQQNAFHAEDTYVPLEKQLKMMETILYLYDKCAALVAKQVPVSRLLATGLFDELVQMKYTVPNDDLSKLDELQKAIDTKLAAVAQG